MKKKYSYFIYAPNSRIPMKDTCCAESKEKIKEDYFVRQLLREGWRINEKSIKEVES